jgi:predicted membrane protein
LATLVGTLLLLRLSIAIAALIFSLASLLVLRLSIRVAALFLRLPLLLLLLLIVLLALGLILVVGLLPLFAVLCPLTPTALSVYLHDRAQQGHDGENEQKGKSISVINFHDYLHRERGCGESDFITLDCNSHSFIPNFEIRDARFNSTTRSNTIWSLTRPYQAAGY